MNTRRRPLEELAEAIAAKEVAPLVDRARAAALRRAQAALEDAIYEELMQEAVRLRTGEASAPRLASREEPAPRGRADAEAGGEAWWAYCVLPSDREVVEVDELEGVEPGSSVRVVVEGELAALVSPVPLPEYGDERLREHLEDIRWVERTARAHEAVLDSVLARASIVPLRLCTLYRDLDGVRRLLREDGERFAAALRRIDGCQEWGVKVFAAPDDGIEEPATPAQGGSGADYLQSRRRQRDARRLALEQRAAWMEEIHSTLCGMALAATTNRPQRQELHGRPGTMLLNAAYLVEEDRVPELKAVIGELQDRWLGHGISLELTGPWPAYNFVSAEAGVMP